VLEHLSRARVPRQSRRAHARARVWKRPARAGQANKNRTGVSAFRHYGFNSEGEMRAAVVSGLIWQQDIDTGRAIVVDKTLIDKDTKWVPIAARYIIDRIRAVRGGSCPSETPRPQDRDRPTWWPGNTESKKQALQDYIEVMNRDMERAENTDAYSETKVHAHAQRAQRIHTRKGRRARVRGPRTRARVSNTRACVSNRRSPR